jgi:hypothetical protein
VLRSTHQTHYQQQRQCAFVVFLLVSHYSQYDGAFETRVILTEVSRGQIQSTPKAAAAMELPLM